MDTFVACRTPQINLTYCCYAESAGILFVVGKDSSGDCVYFYDIEKNSWERQPQNLGTVKSMCTLDEFTYAIMYCNQLPQRFSFFKRQWQSFKKVSVTDDVYNDRFYNSGSAVLFGKVYVLYGQTAKHLNNYWYAQIAQLHCFDPLKNEWQFKASTCNYHFGSSLFVVNRLYVAGGYTGIDDNGVPCFNLASVEVYNEENNTRSVVEQKHIPPNNLGAVEIEGRVYFIINKFPIDSGIRIPPEELYPVHLGDWENLGKIDKNAVLCYLPVKRESLKTE